MSRTYTPFALHTSTNNQFYFILKSPNGQVIMTSETYTAKRSAINGIKSVCRITGMRFSREVYSINK